MAADPARRRAGRTRQRPAPVRRPWTRRPARPAAATVRRLWRSWITTTLLDELTRVDEIIGQRAANVLTSVKTRRKAVATALAACPRDEWIAIGDLFATMRRNRETSPTVARSERALWKLYLVDPSAAASATADSRTDRSSKAATPSPCYSSTPQPSKAGTAT